ncbi:hypothetical protein [Oceanibaculum pacificum]|uniref:hypothetical protein n=1 Tax=Oceanibaculum pacificum TaxID=580166 RepID=UPI0012ECD9A9|nr:hypothetical protein [Oceanibaculum pacificum]
MSEKPSRNPLKKSKDRKLGLALLDAIQLAMPHYPLDAAFEQALPAELAPHYQAWAAARPRETPASW